MAGVVGTLAAVWATSFGGTVFGGHQNAQQDATREAATPVALPLPPAPPEPPQPITIPFVAQPVTVQNAAGLQSPVPPKKEKPKDIPDRTFISPEEVVKAYIAAPTWEDRLPCVADPKSVWQLMATRYENLEWESVKEGFRPGFLTANQPTSNKIVVQVDVRESQPYLLYLRYAVVKVGQGYKVDWLESMKLGEEDSQRAEVNRLGLTSPVLEIEILKRYQYGSYAKFDIRVKNNSNKLLTYWGIDASVFDRDGEYLGKAMTNGTNLKAGAETIADIAFENVKYRDIANWKSRLGGVSAEISSGNGAEVTKYFTLIEVTSKTR